MIGNPCYLIIDSWDMVEQMEPNSSLQSIWDFFYKIIKKINSMAPRLFMKFLSKAICCSKLKTFLICNLLSHWALLNCCDPLWDTFHIPMIKITYTPHIFANLYIGSCVRTFRPFHSTKYKLHVIHGYSLQVARTWARKIKYMLMKAW